VEVYNRWGELLFTSTGYAVPWDGRYNGGLVPVGTYYYAIELNDERFPEPYTGPLTVIR
jgi:gliding motility-associated-like protein